MPVTLRPVDDSNLRAHTVPITRGKLGFELIDKGDQLVDGLPVVGQKLFAIALRDFDGFFGIELLGLDGRRSQFVRGGDIFVFVGINRCFHRRLEAAESAFHGVHLLFERGLGLEGCANEEDDESKQASAATTWVHSCVHSVRSPPEQGILK